MKRLHLMGKLAFPLGMLLLLLSATVAFALPAQPQPPSEAATSPLAGTVAAAAASVWNGHNCSVVVPINVSGLSAGLGGYETRLNWPAGRFSTASADVTINIGTYLTNGGLRSQSGTSGTPLLKAIVGDSVKFGNYSWDDAPVDPGNSANGQLATVSLKPTATCGAAALTLSETQLVDINGSVISLTAQNGATASVFSRFDINGNGFIQNNDASLVRNMVGQPKGGTCGTNYKFDVNGNGFIQNNDVTLVRNKIGSSTSASCTN